MRDDPETVSQRREAIRKAFAREPTVAGAALLLGISRRTLFRWLAADPETAPAGTARAAVGHPLTPIR
jgi:hypothetical protein